MLSRRQLRTLFLVGLVLGMAIPGAAQVFSNQYQATAGTVYQTNSGMDVTMGQDAKIDADNTEFVDANTIKLRTNKGNVTFSSPGDGNIAFDASSDDWLNTSQIQANGSTITISPKQMQEVRVADDVDQVNITQMSAAKTDNGEIDFIYAGTSGSSTVTVTKLSADTPLKAVDLSTGDTLDTDTTDANGVATFTMPNSEHRVDIQAQGSPPYVESSSPRNNEYVKNRSVTLNATVKNPEGGDLNATIFFYNQSTNSYDQVKQTTVTSGTQVSTTVQAFQGDNKWYVKLESLQDGDIRESSEYHFRTPAEITVKNGSSLAVIDNETVNFTIQAVETDYQRTGNTTTGVIDLEGAPEGQLKITANATNFSQGSLSITDPSRARDLHLQPEGDAKAYDQAFALDDKTGAFPSVDTTLVVERYYSGQWREVSSGTFGSDNRYTARIRDKTQYRLTVRNADNDIRQLSLFEGNSTQSDQVVVLTIEQVAPPESDFGELGYRWDAVFTNPENESAYIRFTLDTNADTTVDNLRVVIFQRDDNANEIYNTSLGLVNTLTLTQPLTDSQANETWIVKFSGQVDGEDVSGIRAVGNYQQPMGISAVLSEFWMRVGSVGLLVILGGLFGGIRADVGAVVVGLLGGMFWFINILPSTIAGGAVVAAVAVAAFYSARARRVGV